MPMTFGLLPAHRRCMRRSCLRATASCGTTALRCALCAFPHACMTTSLPRRVAALCSALCHALSCPGRKGLLCSGHRQLVSCKRAHAVTQDVLVKRGNAYMVDFRQFHEALPVSGAAQNQSVAPACALPRALAFFTFHCGRREAPLISAAASALFARGQHPVYCRWCWCMHACNCGCHASACARRMQRA